MVDKAVSMDHRDIRAAVEDLDSWARWLAACSAARRASLTAVEIPTATRRTSLQAAHTRDQHHQLHTNLPARTVEDLKERPTVARTARQHPDHTDSTVVTRNPVTSRNTELPSRATLVLQAEPTTHKVNRATTSHPAATAVLLANSTLHTTHSMGSSNSREDMAGSILRRRRDNMDSLRVAGMVGSLATIKDTDSSRVNTSLMDSRREGMEGSRRRTRVGDEVLHEVDTES